MSHCSEMAQSETILHALVPACHLLLLRLNTHTYTRTQLTLASLHINFIYAHMKEDPYFLNEQLLAHSYTFVEAFLTALQHSLLLIDLSAKVTVHLQHKRIHTEY